MQYDELDKENIDSPSFKDHSLRTTSHLPFL